MKLNIFSQSKRKTLMNSQIFLKRLFPGFSRLPQKLSLKYFTPEKDMMKRLVKF